MCYGHLTGCERQLIERLLGQGTGVRAIAKLMGRSPGTISRELRRNEVGSRYNAGLAGIIAEARRRTALGRRKPKLRGKRLSLVKGWLRQRWSPATIAGYLARLSTSPGSADLRVSHETIYKFVWEDKRSGGDLWRYLRHGRHRKRKLASRHAGKVPGRVSIGERPKVVASRQRIGDFEGDTMVGKGAQSYLVTTVDRKARFLMASLVGGKSAAQVRRAQHRQLRRLPPGVARTLTLDNGTEFAEHRELTRRLKIAVYFADPYSSWQRGTNENTNGLLRAYFPKGTDFRAITPQRLARVVAELNNRPRKCLNYRTPHEG